MSPAFPAATRSGTPGAREALQAALDRIERHDRLIGAFTEVLAERAEREAAGADADPAGDVGRQPLLGVPIGVKELFDVAGGEVSYGSEVFAGRRAEHDSAIVERLRNAGATVVGLTRSHEFGWGITTQHQTRGSTRNPWDLARVPGGSSGGSAAAVAADLVPLAVGSDTGGSIRIPAAFCGVIGLKTTPGRISRAGAVALAPSFDSPGFLARSTLLLAAALQATAGPDPADPATIGQPPLPPDAPDPSRASTLRFAVPPPLAPSALPPARARAVGAVADALASLGGTEVDVDMPDAAELLDVFVPFQMAEALHVHTAILGTYPREADRYGPDVRSRLEQAAGVTIGDYIEARAAAAADRARVLCAFERADVLVSPVGPCGPSTTADPDVVVLGGRQVPLRAAVMPSTVLQNLAGLPSITIPVGHDDDGLPIGIQLTGAPWTEPLLLAVTQALELAEVVTVATPSRFGRE